MYISWGFYVRSKTISSVIYYVVDIYPNWKSLLYSVVDAAIPKSRPAIDLFSPATGMPTSLVLTSNSDVKQKHSYLTFTVLPDSISYSTRNYSPFKWSDFIRA